MPMTEKDIQATEGRFQEVLSEMRKGAVSAVFVVVVGEDDAATTFFSGEDGQEAIAGSICMSRVWEWLLKNGLVMSQQAIIQLGQILRLVR